MAAVGRAPGGGVARDGGFENGDQPDDPDRYPHEIFVVKAASSYRIDGTHSTLLMDPRIPQAAGPAAGSLRPSHGEELTRRQPALHRS